MTFLGVAQIAPRTPRAAHPPSVGQSTAEHPAEAIPFASGRATREGESCLQLS